MLSIYIVTWGIVLYTLSRSEGLLHARRHVRVGPRRGPGGAGGRGAEPRAGAAPAARAPAAAAAAARARAR